MKAFIFALLVATTLFSAQINGNKTRPSVDQIRKDFDAKNFAPYVDNFSIIDKDALVERGIINNASQLENNTSVSSIEDVKALLSCDIGTNKEWTSTAYDFEAQAGTLTCLVAPTGDINNPVGVFKISYPKVAAFFSKDLEAAKIHEADAIDEANTRFDIIKDEKQQIKDSVIGSQQNHLTIPDLLLATLLTDDSIIDVTATRDTNKIQLKNGLTSSIMNTDGTEQNNKDYVLNDLESVFVNYAKLSHISMKYLVYLLSFLAVFGLGNAALHYRKTGEKGKEIYILGFVFSGLLFLPYTQSEQVTENINVDTFQTKYQDFERNGYKLFSSWADEFSGAIIDTQIDSIIAKSGVGTGTQIANAYAGKMQFQKMVNFSQNMQQICNSSYDVDGSMKQKGDNGSYGYIFSDNSSTVFPTSENWAYAEGLYNSYNNYYALVSKNTAYSPTAQSAQANMQDSSNSIGQNFFPQVSLAFCGKNYFKFLSYKDKLREYSHVYSSVTGSSGDESSKIEMIRHLVEFQYSLQRDWGFLGVLGLPITKLQVEMIGNIYHQNTDILDRLKKKIVKGGDGQDLMHSILSSIPYMFVPGAGTVYQTSLSTVRDLRHGYEDSALGWVLGKFGANIAVGAATNIAGFSMAYMTSVSILKALPIVGIIMLGLLRFIVIMMKVFVLHFSMLFMLPMAFIKENISMLAKFSLKILSVMFELPIFVLSIYIAIVANDLVQNIGTLFTKQMVVGLIENSDAQHIADTFTWENLTSLNLGMTDTLKIYFIDGLFEVVVAVFSIFIIYKIIVSLHNLIFEQFEIKGTQAMEGAINDIKNDSANFGGKI